MATDWIWMHRDRIAFGTERLNDTKQPLRVELASGGAKRFEEGNDQNKYSRTIETVINQFSLGDSIIMEDLSKYPSLYYLTADLERYTGLKAGVSTVCS